MNSKRIENYADLILRRGVGLLKGDTLVVEETSVSAIEFLRILTKRAYELGARDVIIHFSDQELTRLRLQNASLDTLKNMDQWWVDSRVTYGKPNSCFLRLNNDDPSGLSMVQKDRLDAWNKAKTEPLKDLNFMKKDNLFKWSASVIPGAEWAQRVYPDDSSEVAQEKLWENILDACYVTEESSTKGWDKHIQEMLENVHKLNQLKIKSLHFTNSLGTDLHLDLCEDAVFAGGICHSPEPDGDLFAPNIPTEEILSTPHRNSANGVVYSSMPFVYSGNVIENMRLEFKDGVVIDYSAEKGQDVLRTLLETDEGSRRLGEVALVPSDSPIHKMGVLFFNTLLDENAACHLALGAGYTDVIRGNDRSFDALYAKGLNSSSVHVDFMFGTDDLNCDAVLQTGETVRIFKDGKFSLERK
ncbi:aminopeptidase [Guggenheimella bovis]